MKIDVISRRITRAKRYVYKTGDQLNIWNPAYNEFSKSIDRNFIIKTVLDTTIPASDIKMHKLKKI